MFEKLQEELDKHMESRRRRRGKEVFGRRVAIGMVGVGLVRIAESLDALGASFRHEVRECTDHLSRIVSLLEEGR
jgi:hypothetical protein